MCKARRGWGAQRRPVAPGAECVIQAGDPGTPRTPGSWLPTSAVGLLCQGSAVGAGIPGGIYVLHFTQDRNQRGRAHPGPGLQEQSVLGGLAQPPHSKFVQSKTILLCTRALDLSSVPPSANVARMGLLYQ